MNRDNRAVRHPRRGKAHRRTVDAYTSTLWPTSTVCGRSSEDLTDWLNVRTIPAAERCKRCWPEAES